MTRLVIGVWYVLWLLQPLRAQETTEPLIDIKQRLLRAPHHDIEEVDSFSKLHLMIAGNLYQTEKHINYAYDEKTQRYDFKNELKYIQPLLNLGDITIANLKTSFGNNIKNMFSSPDEFALAVKYSGINALMHANLHAANIDKATLKRTRDLLNSYDLFHTGAFTDNMQRNGNYPLIINKKGFRIALLNYTKLLTRPSISRDFIINEYDKTYIERDMRMARANKPDFIIVYFDWGANLQDIPSYVQTDLAQFAFQQGANLVVGTQPNTPLRIDYMNYNQNGVMKEGIVAYSLGNLIASNDEVRNRNGFIIDMELKKNNFSGETNVDDWGVIPVYTHYDTSSTKGTIKIFSVPCSAVESGDILPNIPYIEKRRAVNGAYEIRKLVGSVADEIQYNLNEMIVNNVQETIEITNASLNNKFSAKRAIEIEPTDAPVLPVATIGSNNPPSLAMLYEEPPKTDNKNAKPALMTNSKMESEKNKTRQALDGGPAQAKITDGNNAPLAETTTAAIGKKESEKLPEPKLEAGISASRSADISTGKQTAAVKNTPAKDSSVVAANREAAKPAAENPAVSSTAKTAETTTGNNQPAVKNNTTDTAPADKAVSDQSKTSAAAQAETDSKKAAAPVLANGEETNRKTAQQSAATNSEEARKKAAAESATADKNAKPKTDNTNYRTTGKEYELNSPEYAERNKTAKPVTATEREKEKGIEVAAKAPEGISTNVKAELKGNVAPVKEASLKLVVDTFYRIQFYALKQFIPLDTNYYTHLKGYEVREEEGYFKYMLGKYRIYEECEKYWKSQILPRYKQSFIIKYIDGKRILE